MLPGKSNRFRNRYIDHLWQVSATLRTNRRRRGVSRRREGFRTGSLIRSSCLDPEQRPLQGHSRDTSWPLHRPTQRFRLSAWPSCAPVPSWAFSPRRCWVLRASSSSREGAPAAQMTQVSRRGLCPTSSKGELEPSGHPSVCNPNTRQGPLASNKPSWLQNRPESPGYNPAWVMINRQLRALEVTLIMRKFP